MILPLTQRWSVPLRNLFLMPLVVMCMVSGVIPFIQTRLRAWL